MRQRLGKVSKLLPVCTQLFRVQTKVICITLYLSEEQLCLFYLSGSCKALDQPERAGKKSAFGPVQPIGPAGVTIDDAIVGEVLLDRSHCREPSRIGCVDESHERHQQYRGVEHVRALGLDEGF